ncbi:hypothetical protein L207DRAFT_613685 [Hyaloscypha variabilis F]|uniref:MARVEL domain-containing protein n=1 Tax=Hyaloscypha variabilis (strain UAMH 11265 / GT02V1 / F) TaxID=1149755 RepID=A0A2J6S7Y4_HYAVF|nr:hypothetical protein L207DRAFT_613685 [Hyaloscypha variabilis F]
MDTKTQTTVTAAPVDEKTPLNDQSKTQADVKTAAAVVDRSSKGADTPLSPTFSTETEWKITIQNNDGSTNEIMLSPTSVTAPNHQEVRIVMPGAKEEDVDDMEAGKGLSAEETAKKARRMQIYIIIQQSLTALFSIVIIIVMALTLIIYFNSKSSTGAWPSNPILAPTIVLLTMATLSCIADLITLFMHACSGKWVTTMTKTVARIRVIVGFLQAIATAAGAGYLQSAKSSGSDLWGSSCNAPTGPNTIVNNDQSTVCNSNYLAYALAIGTVVIHVLSIIMALWALLKPSGDLKSNAGEAATVLQDAEDKDTQYITNLTKPPTSS